MYKQSRHTRDRVIPIHDALSVLAKRPNNEADGASMRLTLLAVPDAVTRLESVRLSLAIMQPKDDANMRARVLKYTARVVKI